MAEHLTPNLRLPYYDVDDQPNGAVQQQNLAQAVDGTVYSVPVGSMMMWPTSAPPARWLLCQGQQVDAGTYPALAAVLGSAQGKITLPNLSGRVALGSSGTRPLGSLGGSDTVALSPAQMPLHSHGVNDSGHAHYSGVQSSGSPGPLAEGWASGLVARVHDGGWWIYHNTDVQGTGVSIQSAGGGQAHENLPPYMAVNYIIRAQ